MVGFEHIEYVYTWSRALQCNEGYQFINCYKVKNDDHVIIKVLYSDSDTSFVVPLEWTADGIYHTLYITTVEQVNSLKRTKPGAYSAINALMEQLDEELNPEL